MARTAGALRGLLWALAQVGVYGCSSRACGTWEMHSLLSPVHRTGLVSFGERCNDMAAYRSGHGSKLLGRYPGPFSVGALQVHFPLWSVRHGSRTRTAAVPREGLPCLHLQLHL